MRNSSEFTSKFSGDQGKDLLEEFAQVSLNIDNAKSHIDQLLFYPEFYSDDPGIAVQMGAISMLQEASRTQYSHPVQYKQFVNEVNDYVFEKLNPTQAKSYNIARSLVESQNIDERNIYKQVKGATKKQNELLLSILNETYSSILHTGYTNQTEYAINSAYNEARDSLANAEYQSIITHDELIKIQEMLDVWKHTALRLADQNSAQRSITGE
jgi:hypothetical protein